MEFAPNPTLAAADASSDTPRDHAGCADDGAPLFSVVIPLEFHRGQWERCVQAWQAQTLATSRYEVILVMPPEFPERRQLADHLSRTNGVCRVMESDRAHDIGLCAVGARGARGRFLFFTESHCWPEPDVLALCVRAFDEHAEWAGFSCRSLPVVPNRLAQAEADMYETDIAYGMTVHPWRKILDQCFVTRREAYAQSGGLKEEYGHFAEWVLAAGYHELGLVIGYLPEARFHHHYIGELGELREFTLDFVRGEISFLSGDLSEPGARLIETPEEWICRGNFDRQLARALLKISLREYRRADDAARSQNHLDAAMRWLAPALFGDRLSRAGSLITVISSYLSARLANLAGSKRKLSEVFRTYLAALIHHQRLSFIADVRAARRYDPDRSVFSPDHAGFYPVEMYQGARFRWSETAAMMRIDLPAGQIGIRIDCLPVRVLPDMKDLRFYLDGQRISDSDIQIEPFKAVIKVNVAGARVATLGWTCGHFAAPNDRRRLGLPVRSLQLDQAAPPAGAGPGDAPLKARRMSDDGGPRTQPQLALADLAATATLWPLWSRLGWNDVLHRYRRSVLGPLWFTASTAIMVVALGVVYSQLFRAPLAEFMPYVCVSLLIWGFISTIMLEAGDLFGRAENYIKQIRLPYLLYVCRFMWANIIVLAHNFAIYIAVIVWFGAWPGTVALCALPAFVLLAFNGALASVTLGMTSARFRDVPRIIASLVQVLFLITPILWTPAMLGTHAWLVDANPFFHLIEIMRAPLLGGLPAPLTVSVVLGITALNLTVAAAIFCRFRSRIAYWV